jgi:hypothetical protein
VIIKQFQVWEYKQYNKKGIRIVPLSLISRVLLLARKSKDN